ncbi:hypothetical protein, partial [Desulfovibrio inopinatus]|uniref:hypothetical protein n=1 Tax=Desulfovibrio inopinatus TaxID=102109 RepID=UPI0005563A95
GHTVLSFVRQSGVTGDQPLWTFDAAGADPETWIRSAAGAENFRWNLLGATQSDLCIYLGPAGCDAWAEVGAAWAAGVPVVGLWAKGEPIGLNRRMIRQWFSSFIELEQALRQRGSLLAKEVAYA